MGTKALSTATIRDVAQKAGVSQSTVSRVLNKTGYVSAATRARVLRAVESLDYSPSAIAVGLSKSRSRIIGVIVPQIFSPFFSELFYTADKIAEQYDYRLLLCNSDASAERERRLIDDLLSYKIAALFITPVEGPEGGNTAYLNSIRRSGIPVVCVDREPEGIACDGVYIDNFGAISPIWRTRPSTRRAASVCRRLRPRAANSARRCRRRTACSRRSRPCRRVRRF